MHACILIAEQIQEHLSNDNDENENRSFGDVGKLENFDFSSKFDVLYFSFQEVWIVVMELCKFLE